ncbi:MAG: membrane dipeptidase [Anaerolineae bacterium]
MPRLIVDAHEDIAFNAIALGRDFHTSAHEKRALEREAQHEGMALVGLPDLMRGNVRIVFGTLYVSPRNGGLPYAGSSYSTAEEAEAAAREQLDYYRALTQDPHISLIRTRADLDRVVDTPGSLGFVVLMEGADPIVHPEDATRWFEDGVRIVGPSWRGTRYAGGTGQPGPLTDIGRQLMVQLARAGLILDTSHMAEESFFQALDLFYGPVIASHSNARHFVPTDRHLSDEMIKAIIARDGVIGAVIFNAFLKRGWREDGAVKHAVTLSDVLDHIKHICDLAGDTLHVGIGSDFDGGYGAEATPREIDTVADLQRIGEALANAGFKDDEVEGILSGNWLRLLRRTLPTG